MISHRHALLPESSSTYLMYYVINLSVLGICAVSILRFLLERDFTGNRQSFEGTVEGDVVSWEYLFLSSSIYYLSFSIIYYFDSL